MNKNVPDHALVEGNPTKHIGWVCQCGESLTDDLKCMVCDKSYQKTDEGLKGGGFVKSFQVLCLS